MAQVPPTGQMNPRMVIPVAPTTRPRQRLSAAQQSRVDRARVEGERAQVHRDYQINPAGVTPWMWSQQRIDHYQRHNIPIPTDSAFFGPYHPIESQAPPQNLDMSWCATVDITAEEIFKLFPMVLAQYGVLHRLNRNGLEPAMMSDCINTFWDAKFDHGIKADTIKHQLHASDEAWFGQRYNQVNRPRPQASNRIPFTDYTPAQWMAHGNSIRVSDKNNLLTGWLLCDLVGHRAMDDLPEGDACGTITNVLKWVKRTGDRTSTTDDFMNLVNAHGLAAPPLATLNAVPNPDKAWFNTIKNVTKDYSSYPLN